MFTGTIDSLHISIINSHPS